MFKKIVVVLMSLFFLVACGKKEEVKVDFKGPMGGPDPVTTSPSYGPNDSIPTEGQANDPIE